MSKQVCIVIPSYERPQELDRLLNSIYKFETDLNLFDILIMDDYSKQRDDIEKIYIKYKAKYKNIDYGARSKNAGFTINVNTAIRVIQENYAIGIYHNYKYILLLNNDAVFIAPALEKMISAFDDPRNVGIVAPVSSCWCPDSIYPTLLGQDKPYGIDLQPMEARARMRELMHPESWYEKHIGFWGCMIRFDLFERYGIFDERFEVICQDLDWCLRIGKYGWRIKVLDMPLISHHGQTHQDLKPKDVIDAAVERDNQRIREIWPEEWNPK